MPTDLIRPLVGWHHSTFSRMTHDKRVGHSASLSHRLSMLVIHAAELFPPLGKFARSAELGEACTPRSELGKIKKKI